GMALADVGPALDPADLVRRVGIDHVLDGSLLTAAVQHTDRFGNIQLAVFASELDGLFEPGRLAEVVTPDDRYYVRCAETFTDVDAGELVLYADSSGLLSVAVNRGSAAELTAAEAGDDIGVEFSPSRHGRIS
ncbi:MAG: SAM hydroxide adenosyltransferase, partial [Gaiellales bacterium]